MKIPCTEHFYTKHLPTRYIHAIYQVLYTTTIPYPTQNTHPTNSNYTNPSSNMLPTCVSKTLLAHLQSYSVLSISKKSNSKTQLCKVNVSRPNCLNSRCARHLHTFVINPDMKIEITDNNGYKMPRQCSYPNA